jgi:hypothetical protein
MRISLVGSDITFPPEVNLLVRSKRKRDTIILIGLGEGRCWVDQNPGVFGLLQKLSRTFFPARKMRSPDIAGPVKNSRSISAAVTRSSSEHRLIICTTIEKCPFSFRSIASGIDEET